ncbi:MAG: chemotaxis protein CheB, partial [Planctomycetes bacterium]|nr:chemotaxis protein CheB [Planctomycetota bacterium]
LLLAPGRGHLRLRRRGHTVVAAIDEGAKVSGFRPSVDVLFESVAKTFGSDAVGIVMTGMGCDGADGIRALRKAKAQTLAQDQESCIVYGMPKAAAATGCVDHVVSLTEIPDALVRSIQAIGAVNA